MTDFQAIISCMKKNGAFWDYLTPLGWPEIDAQAINRAFSNPKFPGDMAYGLQERGAVVLVNRELSDIPPEIIHIHRQSMLDAVGHYMPQDVLAESMREFFATPSWPDYDQFRLFFDTGNLHNNIVVDIGDGYLPDELTMKLDDPARLNANGTIYTAQEYMIALDVIQKHPAILVAVQGYQAAHLIYLTALGMAIGSSPDLSDTERERGGGVLEILTGAWNSSNFTNRILPAICLQYALRQSTDAAAQPNRDDFINGLGFVQRVGGFKLSIGVDGKMRIFVCPAMRFIMDSTAQDVTGSNGSDFSSTMAGTGLFCIYRQIKDNLAPDLAGKVREYVENVHVGRTEKVSMGIDPDVRQQINVLKL